MFQIERWRQKEKETEVRLRDKDTCDQRDKTDGQRDKETKIYIKGERDTCDQRDKTDRQRDKETKIYIKGETEIHVTKETKHIDREIKRQRYI